jgi:hypothetical protein
MSVNDLSDTPYKVISVGPTGIDILTDLSASKERRQWYAPRRIFAGGVCRNITVNLAVLGVEATLITQNYGNSLVEYRISNPFNLNEQYVETPIDHVGRLGKYKATFDGEDIVDFVSEYEFAQSVFNENTAAELALLLKDVDILITCSDVSESFWFNLPPIRSSKGFGHKCLVTSGLPLPQNYLTWLSSCDLFFINSHEADCLDLSPAELCKEAIRQGVKKVFVTLGKEGGVFYCDGHEEVTHVTSSITTDKVVSPVGAGDAFVAGIICSMLRNYPIRKAVELSLRLAALKVQQDGSAFLEGISLDDLETISYPKL